MARQQGRIAKSKPRVDQPAAPTQPREQGNGQSRRRGAPVGLPLVGAEVLEAVGSNGKVGRAMHDVIYSPDDENVITRLGPEQSAHVAFRPDHELGDAGAELAEDFGRDFLLAATTGDDISAIENPAATSVSEVGGPFIEEVVPEAMVPEDTEEEDEEDPGDAVPSSRSLRASEI